MSEIEFRNNDAGYLAWIKKNQNGLVLTTTRSPIPHYMSLHRASCRLISEYAKNQKGNAFTGKAYIKICANDPIILLAWIGRNGGVGFTKQCSRCKPNLPKQAPVNLESIDAEFQAALSKSKTNAKARRERLKKCNSIPELIFVVSKAYRRNPDVVAEVLERALGKCESCGNEAPFLKAVDQEPYLEVHHRVQLSKGGKDTVKNAIALCPNCHRREHHG